MASAKFVWATVACFQTRYRGRIKSDSNSAIIPGIVYGNRPSGSVGSCSEPPILSLTPASVSSSTMLRASVSERALRGRPLAGDPPFCKAHAAGCRWLCERLGIEPHLRRRKLLVQLRRLRRQKRKEALMSRGARRLTGKVCVVTEAAGAFADTVADQLTSEGATVVGVDRREHGVGVHSLQHDLTDEDEVQALFSSIKRDFGRIDVLYNSVGLNDRDDHSALDMPLSVWERVLAANLTTTFLRCAPALPRLRVHLARRGVRVNACSSWARSRHPSSGR